MMVRCLACGDILGCSSARDPEEPDLCPSCYRLYLRNRAESLAASESAPERVVRGMLKAAQEERDIRACLDDTCDDEDPDGDFLQ